MLCLISDGLWINPEEIIYLTSSENASVIHFKNQMMISVKPEDAKLIQEYLLTEYYTSK